MPAALSCIAAGGRSIQVQPEHHFAHQQHSYSDIFIPISTCVGPLAAVTKHMLGVWSVLRSALLDTQQAGVP